MNRWTKIAIAAGFSLASLSGIAFADMFQMSDKIDAAVREFKGTEFRVDQLKPSGAGDLEAEATAAKGTPDVKTLQEAIHANPMLMEQLEAKNVEIENIVSAEVATDGGIVFYTY
ncbi:hypothetical protein [Ferirhizobium litorale]|uniref:Uncharacterized protein n=1 Tax=Ferirhizobium litorale TaxID=2927786 RepID=A0AAE3QF17_9HYPH|nr:hypothetical protein [Fererhizobium litorale]MDI7922830.1 hypothetical protein [Fererhizobium litorale]